MGGRRHWNSYTWTLSHPDGENKTWCNRWPTVVRLSNRVEIEWFDQTGPKDEPNENEISVSDVGLLAAAEGDTEGSKGL